MHQIHTVINTPAFLIKVSSPRCDVKSVMISNPHLGYPLILTPGLTPIISLVNEQRSLLGETGFSRCKKVEE